MTIPDPQPGLIICFSYLWDSEHASGDEEGSKNRPCVIASTRTDAQGNKIILALPVTHREPDDRENAVEIPRKVKEFLGLDNARSWIVLSEANETEWPGCDVRPVSRLEKGKFDYGFLPPGLFGIVSAKILKLTAEGKLKVVPRSPDLTL